MTNPRQAVASRLPKAPWNLRQMEPGRRESMLAAIRVIVVDTVAGQARLDQHKSDADHVAAAYRLARREATGHQWLARKMRRTMAMRPWLGYDVS